VSYLCLATENFEAVTRFYRDVLASATLAEWDRSGARGVLLDLNGLRLEILDATREKSPLQLNPPGDRLNLVIEVTDVEAVHRRLALDVPGPAASSWGASWFTVRDPDGVPVRFVQWLGATPKDH
jgi:catechol 2,3-dioxygenase-like lactoylglutathione lyase family enzyme